MIDRAERRHAVLALGVFTIALTAARLWMASRFGLAPDEAYYWTWSRALALAYRDHPPLVAYAVALGTALWDGEVGVRLVSIACGAASIPLLFLVAQGSGLGRRAAALTAAGAALLPIASAGALIATPDSILGLAWLAGGLALVRLAAGADPRHWVLFGAATACGLWAKHSALLMPIAAGVCCVFAPRLRASLRSRGFAVGAALFAVGVAPYALAELARGAPSFVFQLDHLRGGLPSSGDPSGPAAFPRRLGELLAGQVGLLTPPVAILFGLSFGPRGREDAALRIAQTMSIIPMAAAAVSALFAHPEQNWASLGHPFAVVAAARALEGRFGGRARAAWAWTAGAVLVAAALLIQAHALRPFLPLPPERDPVSRLHGWGDLSAVARFERGAAAIVCDNYGLASELRWENRDQTSAPPVSSLDRASAPPAGRWLLLDERGDFGDRGLEDAPCESVRELATLELRRGDGIVVRNVEIREGVGCSGIRTRASEGVAHR